MFTRGRAETPADARAKFEASMASQRDWFADYQQRFAAVQQHWVAFEDDDAGAPLLAPADRVALAKRKLAIERQQSALKLEQSNEMARFSSEQKALIELFGERNAVRSRANWRGLALFAAALWVPATTAVLLGAWGRKELVNPDFYIAVATLIPALVIAGFVELSADHGVIKRAGHGWKLISFVLPATGGETACLAVLVHHHSTQGAYFFTVLGLSLTSITLVSFAVMHPDESPLSGAT